METFTVRGAAKFVVNGAIVIKSTSIAKDLMTDYTALEEDSMTIRLGSKVIGSFVGTKLKPTTDKIVDKTADFIVAKRNKKKNTEEIITPEIVED